MITAGAKGAKVESITVTLFNRKEYVAKVIGSDEKSDLAVVKVDESGLKTLSLGNSDGVEVGDVVLAVGTAELERSRALLVCHRLRLTTHGDGAARAHVHRARYTALARGVQHSFGRHDILQA